MEQIQGATATAIRPGNSVNSVGHQAKAAIAEARAAGIDLPKNAHGIAASAIAKGAEPGSVFAAMVVPEVGDTSATDSPTLEVPPQQEEIPSVAETGYEDAASAMAGSIFATDPAKTALTLLENAGQG